MRHGTGCVGVLWAGRERGVRAAVGPEPRPGETAGLAGHSHWGESLSS